MSSVLWDGGSVEVVVKMSVGGSVEGRRRDAADEGGGGLQARLKSVNQVVWHDIERLKVLIDTLSSGGGVGE